jgi:hypothetical protein
MSLNLQVSSLCTFQRVHRAAVLLLPILLLTGGTMVAAPLDQVKITPTPTQPEDEFGFSVSLSGTTMLAGAPLRNEPASDSGAAFVFDQQTSGAWTQIKKLAPADQAANDNFGWAVALSDDTAIVGSKADDDSATTSGSAYIFQRNHGGPQNWGQVIKLHASDPAPFDQFGYAVAISGSTAVVGAWPKDGGGGDRAGAVYIFERDLGGPNAWGQSTKLTASDSTGFELFGYSVAVSGDSVLIGAPADDNFGPMIGSTYVYQRDAGAPGGWRETQKLLPSDSAPLNKFGGAVSLSNGTAVIGAYWDDTKGNEAGAAYVFDQDDSNPDNWNQVAKLTASDGATGDWFGQAGAITNDVAVISALQDDDRDTSSGSAYVFRRHAGAAGEWGQVAKVVGFDTARSHAFGTSVSISGNMAVAGAPGQGLSSNDPGKAYAFTIPEPSATALTILALFNGAFYSRSPARGRTSSRQSHPKIVRLARHFSAKTSATPQSEKTHEFLERSGCTNKPMSC